VGIRNHNYRLAKVHRTYTVDEVARLYSVHRNTVRDWMRAGLPTIDRVRPIVIAGCDLGAFLLDRRQGNKRPCAAGELYCCRCRMPQRPADGQVSYQPMSATSGNLVGICVACSSRMFRRVNVTRLDAIRGELVIRMRVAQEHIGESPQPSVNCAFS
jgi:hypothetical protein